MNPCGFLSSSSLARRRRPRQDRRPPGNGGNKQLLRAPTGSLTRHIAYNKKYPGGPLFKPAQHWN
jgi:hypothetical protein